MKYYCKNCGSEYRAGNDKINLLSEDEHLCPFCRVLDVFEAVPDYETPEQYEKRTGKAYPEKGAVWIFVSFMGNAGWVLGEYNKSSVIVERSPAVVIADPPVPPPDDWRPNNDFN